MPLIEQIDNVMPTEFSLPQDITSFFKDGEWPVYASEHSQLIDCLNKSQRGPKEITLIVLNKNLYD